MREIAENIALLTKLVGEINTVARKLAEQGITVLVKTGAAVGDPLAEKAVVRLELDLEPRPKF